jgi:hypothetical protein
LCKCTLNFKFLRFGSFHPEKLDSSECFMCNKSSIKTCKDFFFLLFGRRSSLRIFLSHRGGRAEKRERRVERKKKGIIEPERERAF